MEHPRSVSVSVDEWANFSCLIDTSEDVRLMWGVVLPKIQQMNERRVIYYTESPLGINLNKKNITFQYETSSNSSSEAAEIRLLTTSQMDGAVIQCAATGNSRSVVPSYSMFAILQVQPLPESSGDGASG